MKTKLTVNVSQRDVELFGQAAVERGAKEQLRTRFGVAEPDRIAILRHFINPASGVLVCEVECEFRSDVGI